MLPDRDRNVHIVPKVVRVLVQGVRLQVSCVELGVASELVCSPPPFSSSRRTILDMVIAVTHLLSHSLKLRNTMVGCHILGLVVQFCLVGANLWYGYLVLDLFRAIRNPFG